MMIITAESLKKKLIWDLLPHDQVQAFMATANVLPGSDESEALEHRDSHFRTAQASPVAEVVALLGALSGEILGRCILENQGVDYDETLVQSYMQVCAASADAVVANLLDMDLLHLGGHS